MLDAATGKSKGFGFVLFSSEEEGKAAYDALNRKGVRCCGHNFTLVIYPSEHDGKNADVASRALYIRNVPLSATKEQIEVFLNSFGHLTYCAIREDHYGNPVWVIYAEYETLEAAKNALSKIHGNNTFFQNSVPLLAKFEDTNYAKVERRKRREESNAQVSNSGTIFPPPRPDGHSATGSMEHKGSLTSPPQYYFNPSQSSFPYSAFNSFPSATSDPFFYEQMHYAMNSHAQQAETGMAFPMSMPSNLLHPTPGYCYTLGESGQQIFIPASTLSPSTSPPLVDPHSAPQFYPRHQATDSFPGKSPAGGGDTLLQPQTGNSVFLNGSHQYVLCGENVSPAPSNSTSNNNTLLQGSGV
ncbi:RNA-binding protein [Angomonas deanei]|uniref:RNA recognition motif. (A.k.a. RRM, RBD, or RNP domain), putative n=1 Tax=Angomonas deanei TaxID=59799 RepID=A0A7G2CGG6_9TRYP|nr:RNA-binding protein [Angomonas deanei]CAD2218061.1 RNA recognition motif. (a.k.a. RRM, RBD, or RNP domain), putative [Angomonas deanei]|eukprot:EPY21034.1 RNA-binding protein [Angomonas deanei]